MMTADYISTFTIANAWPQNSCSTGPLGSGDGGNGFLKFCSKHCLYNVSKTYHNRKEKEKRRGEIASFLNVPGEYSSQNKITIFWLCHHMNKLHFKYIKTENSYLKQ